MQAKRQESNVFKTLKEKQKRQHRTLYGDTLSFKNEGERKIFFRHIKAELIQHQPTSTRRHIKGKTQAAKMRPDGNLDLLEDEKRTKNCTYTD